MISERAQGTAEGDDLQLLADLFHALSQPLTTLRCCLGLSLQKSSAGRQNPRDLEIASQAAESVTRLVAGIRELVESASPPQAHAAANLDECLRGVVEDLGLVAVSARLTVSLVSAASLQVEIEPGRLRQGLFHLLEFALRSCQAGTELSITAAEEGESVGLRVEGRVRDPLLSADGGFPELERRMALAVGRRILTTAGGRLQLQSGSGHLSLTIHLPRTTHQAVSPTAPASRCCA